MASRSVTLTQIKLEQDYAEAKVRAESGLIGERMVSWARLAMFMTVGFATTVVPMLRGVSNPTNALQQALIIAYATYTVVAIIVLRVFARPHVGKGMVLPLFATVIDAGFYTAMGLISARLGMAPRPEVTAAVLATLIGFSVARQTIGHVLFSAVISQVGIIVVAAWQGWFDVGFMVFVFACYGTICVLVSWANLRLRVMFADVRRRENLSRLLPSQVVDRVLAGNGVALQPVQREVTILFSDIRDFTALSEHMAPAAVLEFLDEYFGHMGQIVKGHEGMLNKFIGDGMLAVWGAPDLQEDHAVRATRAALDMKKKLVELNAGWVARGAQPIRVGIGLHTGVVAAGMLGKDQREYTVIGDAVNLASRIEGLTKSLGHEILASDSTWQKLGGKFSGDRVGEERQVKGREGAVVVYTVRDLLTP